MESAVQPNIVDLAPELGSVRQAVLTGLGKTPKCLPPWLFYDDRGSALFEAITEQPEYYPTRTELEILRSEGAAIAAAIGPGCRLVELGSGSPRKARQLLRSLDQPGAYVAIDVSGDQLRKAICTLAREFPQIEMTGIVSDYSPGRDLPIDDDAGPLVGFFPGSTIGNMEPAAAQAFLTGWRARFDGGGMLIGVDLVKDSAILNAAYNDAAGITAAFNLNMIQRIDRELGSNLGAENFKHIAFFNEQLSRIEMHLEHRGERVVEVAGQAFAFGDGERIHTESSYKYTLQGFKALAEAAGFMSDQVFVDDQQLFSVHLLRA